jgi:hypothetical protein
MRRETALQTCKTRFSEAEIALTSRWVRWGTQKAVHAPSPCQLPSSGERSVIAVSPPTAASRCAAATGSHLRTRQSASARQRCGHERAAYVLYEEPCQQAGAKGVARPTVGSTHQSATRCCEAKSAHPAPAVRSGTHAHGTSAASTASTARGQRAAAGRGILRGIGLGRANSSMQAPLSSVFSWRFGS